MNKLLLLGAFIASFFGAVAQTTLTLSYNQYSTVTNEYQLQNTSAIPSDYMAKTGDVMSVHLAGTCDYDLLTFSAGLVDTRAVVSYWSQLSDISSFGAVTAGKDFDVTIDLPVTKDAAGMGSDFAKLVFIANSDAAGAKTGTSVTLTLTSFDVTIKKAIVSEVTLESNGNGAYQLLSPDTLSTAVALKVGDIVEISLEATSNVDITDFQTAIIDETALASYWTELSNYTKFDTPSITAGKAFSITAYDTIKVAPIGSGYQSQDVLLYGLASDKITLSITRFTAQIVGSIYTDYSALSAKIASAKNIEANAVIGTASGNYPAEALTLLQSAIDDAQAVNSNANATQNQVDAATTALSAEIVAFLAKIIFNGETIILPFNQYSTVTNDYQLQNTSKIPADYQAKNGDVISVHLSGYSDYDLGFLQAGLVDTRLEVNYWKELGGFKAFGPVTAYVPFDTTLMVTITSDAAGAGSDFAKLVLDASSEAAGGIIETKVTLVLDTFDVKITKTIAGVATLPSNGNGGYQLTFPDTLSTDFAVKVGDIVKINLDVMTDVDVTEFQTAIIDESAQAANWLELSNRTKFDAPALSAGKTYSLTAYDTIKIAPMGSGYMSQDVMLYGLATGDITLSMTKFTAQIVGSIYTDFSALLERISYAKNIAASAVEGTANGNYPAGSINILDSAISVAQDVYSTAGATQVQVDAATAALSAEITAFQAKIIFSGETIILPFNQYGMDNDYQLQVSTKIPDDYQAAVGDYITVHLVGISDYDLTYLQTALVDTRAEVNWWAELGGFQRINTIYAAQPFDLTFDILVSKSGAGPGSTYAKLILDAICPNAGGTSGTQVTLSLSTFDVSFEPAKPGFVKLTSDGFGGYQKTFPDTLATSVPLKVGDIVKVTVEGTSNLDLTNFHSTVVDETILANYWQVLSSSGTFDLGTVFANKPFSFVTYDTIKTAPLGSGFKSQDVLLGANATGTVSLTLTKLTAEILESTPNKQILSSTIASAKDLIANAVVGSETGNYPAESVDLLNVAINEAETVYNNIVATQGQIDASNIALTTAIATFQSNMIVLPVEAIVLPWNQYGNMYDYQLKNTTKIPANYQASSGDYITVHVVGTTDYDIDYLQFALVDTRTEASYWTELAKFNMKKGLIKAGETFDLTYELFVYKNGAGLGPNYANLIVDAESPSAGGGAGTKVTLTLSTFDVTFEKAIPGVTKLIDFGFGGGYESTFPDTLSTSVPVKVGDVVKVVIEGSSDIDLATLKTSIIDETTEANNWLELCPFYALGDSASIKAGEIFSFVVYDTIKTAPLGTGYKSQDILLRAQAAGTVTLTLTKFTASIIATSDELLALYDTITGANALYNQAIEGTRNGNYQAGSKAELNNAILTANLVYNSSDPSKTDVSTATDALKAAIVLFNSKIISFTPSFEISNSEVSVPAESSTSSLNVTTNTEWNATSVDEWLTVSQSSSSGDGILYFTAATNTATTTRSANISIEVNGLDSRTVTVTQLGAVQPIVVSQTNVNLGANITNTVTINVTTSTTWMATTEYTWISVSQNTYTGNGTVSISLAANTFAIERTATVTLVSDGGEPSTITITQAAATPYLTVAPDSVNFKARVANKATVSVVSNAAWTASVDKSWLTLNSTTGIGNATLSLQSAPCNVGSPRVATVTILANGVVPQVVKVYQSPDSIALVKTFTNASIQLGSIPQSIDLTKYFEYFGEGTMSFSATSSNLGVISPILSGNTLGFVSYSAGSAIISITALSSNGALSTTAFNFAVTSSSTTTCGTMTVKENITNVLCYGALTGKASVSVTGGTAPYVYKWSNTRSDSAITNVAAGTYAVIVTDSKQCVTVKSIEITQPGELKLGEMLSSPKCNETDGNISLSVSGGTIPYVYTWNDGSKTNSISGISVGLYSVTISDKNGCVQAKSFELSNSGAPVISLDSLLHSKCAGNSGAVYISVSGGAIPYTYSWNDGNILEDRTKLAPGDYNVTVTDKAGCKSVLSTEVKTPVIEQPRISLVTVGEESHKNIVVWQRQNTNAIDFYTVYRESLVARVYDSIGKVPYDSVSIFVDKDTVANPFEQAWRYKISATDLCGNETPLSTEFKTIYLQQGLGLQNSINLLWDSYEGSDYYTYSIYRKSTSKGLELIKQVSASINRFTDLTPPKDLDYYYVAIDFPEIIDPSKLKSDTGPYSQSLSNVAESEVLLGNKINRDLHPKATIFPVPATSSLSVNAQIGSCITITNITGNVILQFTSKDEVCLINCKEWNSGIYFVKIKDNKSAVVLKALIK